MRVLAIILLAYLPAACNKTSQLKLPEHKSEIVVEMYLEDMRRLKCLVSETLPYTSTSINQLLNNAEVIFSDGIHTDTLMPVELYDYETGRQYNYASTELFFADSSKTCTLTIIDSLNRKVTATTTIPRNDIPIDSIVYETSATDENKFSVGFSFSDPAGIENYYRMIIGKGINNYTASHTDLLLTDIAFDGKQYSFNTEADYERNDTVTVRLYSLLKEHFNYLQSAENARSANTNPFVQPVRVQSNINGGQGIFTAICYDERTIIVR